MKKLCNECGKDKELKDFPNHIDGKFGVTKKCKICTRIYKKIYRSQPHIKKQIKDYNTANRKKRNTYYRECNKNPKRKEWMRNYNRQHKLKKNYNLTLEDFNNMLKKQQNSCAICNNVFKSGARYIHVDHCHKTNKVRGLLCPYCNVGIGNFFDKQHLLNKAIKYLDKSQRGV